MYIKYNNMKEDRHMCIRNLFLKLQMTMADVLYLEFKPESRLKIFVMSEEDVDYTPLSAWPYPPKHVTIDKEALITGLSVEKYIIKDQKGLRSGCIDNFLG